MNQIMENLKRKMKMKKTKEQENSEAIEAYQSIVKNNGGITAI